MKFCISADDGGLHPKIDEAILIGVSNKIISEFSIVACGKNFLKFTENLRRENQTEVGFHACFTDGEKALSGTSFLTDKNSNFISKSKLILRSILMPTKVNDSLRLELQMQIAKIQEQGLTITHMDSHQHLHALPFFHQTFLEISHQLDVPIRIPKIISIFPRVAAVPLSIFSKVLHRRCEINSIPYYFGVGFEHSGQNNQKTIGRYIEIAAASNFEFFCHPGTSNREIEEKYSHWGYNWEEELKEISICLSGQNLPSKLNEL